MPNSTSKPEIHFLNGPNLNLLGVREAEIYGHETLANIEENCLRKAASLNLEIKFHQTNSEGSLIDSIHNALKDAQGVIINPGAYTHTSIAICDALLALNIPKIELHLSNIHAREEFRRQSYITPACHGMICGFGAQGYELALEAIARLIHNQHST